MQIGSCIIKIAQEYKLTQKCVKNNASVNTYNTIMLIENISLTACRAWSGDRLHHILEILTIVFLLHVLNYGHSLHVKPSGKLPTQ